MSYSFFIPRMSTSYNSDTVRAVFAGQLAIGDVMRVDFVDIPGDDKFVKAFVHMNSVFDSEANTHILQQVFKNNDSVRAYPDAANAKSYWLLLKNKHPVVETRLNIHQVVENANILQELVFKQINQIDRLQQTIGRLLYRVYDSEGEIGDIMENYNYVKSGNYCNTRWLDEDGNPVW
jgi:hypothetical protein